LTEIFAGVGSSLQKSYAQIGHCAFDVLSDFIGLTEELQQDE
jgi:hypothetical protein